MPHDARRRHWGRSAALVLAASAFALSALAGPRPAAATIVGDPTVLVGQGRFAAGAEVDLGLSDDIETDRLWVTGTYGFAPNVDGFLRAGFWDGDSGAAEVDGFGFGGGVRAEVARQRDWRFGGLAQVMYNIGEAKVTFPGLPPFIPATTVEEDFDWIEIDVAGVASFRGLGQIVPYVGGKVGFITGDPDDDFGVTILGGGSFAITPQLLVGGELRLIDDDALGLYVRYVF